MNLQWVRSAKGNVVGVALFFGKRVGVVLAAGDGSRSWRICDDCKTEPANVFCREHSKYLCIGCLTNHQHERPSRCRSMLSIAAVQDLMHNAEVGWP